MFVALLVAVAVGVIVAATTIADQRLQIADDSGFAVLVCVSGAIAGWALIDIVTGLSDDGFDVWDVVGATLGALGIAAGARRGRRRTFSELSFEPRSE